MATIRFERIYDVRTKDDTDIISTRLLGKIEWHSRVICYVADVATPLHMAHQTPFQWTTTEQDAYDSLKKMLSKVSVVQPLDWTKDFQVFVDASDIVIGSALMQLSELN